MIHYLWPCITAFLAGIINALAGGGTLLTFPALVAVLSRPENGVQNEADAIANATSTLALFPGSMSSAWAYRQELDTVKHWLKILAGPSLIGGALGALLVASYPEEFKEYVPWLILLASILFCLQPVVSKWLGHTATTQPSQQRVMVVVIAQFFVSLYGGYFGAGIGILMLSALGLMGMSNLHEMNALKTVLAAIINGVTVAIFLVKDVQERLTTGKYFIHWPLALCMIALATLGGYVGAKYGRRLPTKYVRYFVIAIGFTLTAYYLARPYFEEPPAKKTGDETTASAQR